MAAPLGPMGVLCMKRTLSHGRRSGFITGLGIATVDALYGSVAALGLTFIIAFIIQYSQIIQVLGIFVLVYLGVSVYREKPRKLSLENNAPVKLLTDYTSSVALTICNPITILSFMGALAALDVVGGLGKGSGFSLVGGIFLGSLSWWLILSLALSSVRRALTRRQQVAINKIAGSIIFLFALTLAIRVAILIL